MNPPPLMMGGIHVEVVELGLRTQARWIVARRDARAARGQSYAIRSTLRGRSLTERAWMISTLRDEIGRARRSRVGAVVICGGDR